MKSKLERINDFNKQKCEINFRENKLFNNIVLIFLSLWLISGLYSQISSWSMMQPLMGKNSVVQNKNFIYLIFIHIFLLTGICLLKFKSYSKNEYFWGISRIKHYVNQFWYFIPSIIFLIMIISFLIVNSYWTIFLLIGLLLLGNWLALNLRMIIKGNILFLVIIIISYIGLALVSKIGDLFSIRSTNIVIFVSIIVNIILSYNVLYSKNFYLDFSFKRNKKCKSKLDFYFLNILRGQKIVPLSIFIIISIVINSYMLKNIPDLKMWSIGFDYSIQIALVYFISNVAYSLDVDIKLKKYFLGNMFKKKIITFNVFVVIFLMVSLIVNNIDFSLFIKNINDQMYFYDTLIVLCSIMFGSQVCTLLYNKKTKYTGITVCIVSLIPSIVTIPLNQNKFAYVGVSILYWVLANFIIYIKERYEKYF